MLFFVKTLTGKRITIIAEPNDTIEKIKDIISKKEEIPSNQQKLIYSGQWLQNNKKLRDYTIKDDTTLLLMTGVRGMDNIEEKQNHIKFTNKSGTETIKLHSYHISSKSDKFDGSDMIGIILYQHNGKSEWELNGLKCKSGYIYLCKTDNLKDISIINLKDISTKHAKCYKKLFDKDPDYMEIVGAGFAYRNNEWIYNSGTFNAPNHSPQRNWQMANYYQIEFKDEWHDNNRRMHMNEEKWLKQIIEQWISSEFTESTLYVSYVTWSWLNDEWIDYDKVTNKYIEDEYEKYINDGNVALIHSIDLNVGDFANNKKLSDKYKIYFSAPNICLNPISIHSRNYPKWKNDNDKRNTYFLQKNYVTSKYRIVRRRDMFEIQYNWYQSCVCL
eukprot:203878_1